MQPDLDAPPKVIYHDWHVMQHQSVEILGLDSENQPAVFRTGESVEGVACFECGEPLKSDLSNAQAVCPMLEHPEDEDEV